jgi:lipopolysaccharide transport protein LptA
MKISAVICALFFIAALGKAAHAQGSAPATLSTRPPTPAGNSPSPSPTPKTVKPVQEKTAKPKTSDPAAPAPEPIVTEIYADQATFDSTKSLGVFTGHIVVVDPRFQLQGDKLTIFLSNKENQGLDKAVVEGNVGVVRDRPDPQGGPPDRMVGRADKAVYTAKDGNFELTGNPRVQQGMNTHVATSPETVMILNEKGQLQTSGPSRTEIRQAPKSEASPTP